MPNTSTATINWIPQAVENLLHNHDILNRTELAKHLGFPKSTIHATFAQDWSGEASLRVLAAMAVSFRVPLNRIVTEPGTAGSRRPGVRSGGQVR